MVEFVRAPKSNRFVVPLDRTSTASEAGSTPPGAAPRTSTPFVRAPSAKEITKPRPLPGAPAPTSSEDAEAMPPPNARITTYLAEPRVPTWAAHAHRERRQLVGYPAAPAVDYWTVQAPPLVILMRGAPGSGKSTWAQQYKVRWGAEAMIISATQYFTDAEGQVHFYSGALAQSHTWCANVLYWLCELRTPRIVVDNTHTRLWECQPYRDIAWQHGYRVFQHVCTGTYQNTSGVPEARVQEFRARFEQDTLLPHYTEDAPPAAPGKKPRAS